MKKRRTVSVYSLIVCTALYLVISGGEARAQKQSGQKPHPASAEQGRTSETPPQKESPKQAVEQEQGCYRIILKQSGIQIDTEKAVSRDIQIQFEKAQEAQQKGESGVTFAFNSVALSPVARDLLKTVARDLLKKDDYWLVVEGHTDSVGSAEYNKKLGLRRATAVKKFLAKEGQLQASRIQTISYGEEKPIASNDTPEGRAENRRVEISVKYLSTQQQK